MVGTTRLDLATLSLTRRTVLYWPNNIRPLPDICVQIHFRMLAYFNIRSAFKASRAFLWNKIQTFQSQFTKYLTIIYSTEYVLSQRLLSTYR